MADRRPEGTLARTREGKPGLPRGRSHLPPGDVQASQRERLLRSVIAAVAEVFYLDMPGAGPLADERLDAATRLIADLNRKWHARARARHPEWPAVPGQAYLALSGAAVELVRAVVRTGDTDALPGLEEPIMSLYLAVLASRPWTA